jgi:hypothetical protein
MKRTEPKPTTIKRLFALSKNQCAFPQCNLPIVEEGGTVTGIVCHIKARSEKGPRFDPSQTDEERHGFENLVLMCSRHSKIIDSDPGTYCVETLRDIKRIHEKDGAIEISREDAAKAARLLESYRVVYIASGSSVKIEKAETIRAERVQIARGKSGSRKPILEGSVGSCRVRRSYVKHLIDRYNEFASDQPDRRFSFAAIYTKIRKDFGMDWDMISLGNFEALVTYLQGRIDRTRLGRINSSKRHPNYSTFAEFLEKHGEEPL